MSQDGNAYDIRVRLPVHERSRVETLSNLKVRSTSGALVDLSNLVRSERGVGPSRIDRESRQRQVTVLAGLDGIALGDAQKIVNEVAGRVVPGHLTAEYSGDAQIMEESFGHMISALLLAVMLVYMILAVQFDSFLQPLTIMISLPLSVVGAFGALALTGMTLSIFSMIGIIMLMGLVTKNAILLVDFTNQLRGQGKSVHDALVQAGVLRLRPILMTALSMIFGMLPVALAFSEGGEVRAPMAVCVIGGMITSTVLTLAVVPVVYSLMARVPGPGLLSRLRRIFRRASTTPAAESC
jgi:HAE1 family hydrophobic/amphiphilic exporter-1